MCCCGENTHTHLEQHGRDGSPRIRGRKACRKPPERACNRRKKRAKAKTKSSPFCTTVDAQSPQLQSSQ
eukprot:5616550-Prymnesium_polylepis.1